MQRVKIKKNRKLRIISLLSFIFIVFVFVYYFVIVCPVVVRLSEEKIRSISTQTMSKVVGDVLVENNVTYNELVNISYSSNNEIESVEVDSIKVNILIREITEKLEQEFASLNNAVIDIALGTFTGIPFLYNLGPRISVKLVPVGIINTKLNSSFISAGINQTLHRFNFDISATVSMVLPVKTQNFVTDLEVLLCESVIIGKIPEFYFNN